MPQGKRRGHGEGSVYPRKDGRYAGYIRLEAGKKKYFYGSTRKEVQDKVRAALNEKERGTLATGPNILLRDYLPEWLETVCKPPLRSAGTYGDYQSMIKVHLIPEIGHLKVRSLTMRHVQSLIAKKIASGSSPATVHQIHNVLCCALKSAMEWEMVPKNVAHGVSLPKIEKRETAILSEHEAQKLLEVAREHRLEGMILLGVTTGLRQGEIRALKWSHIDIRAGVLYIKRSVRYVYHTGFVEKEPKTRAGRRKILLPDVVIETLKRQREHQEAEAKRQGVTFEEWNPKSLIFPNKGKNYMHGDKTRKEFYQLLEQAGLPKMRFHDLRHSAATILLVKGVHPKVVQELLGHASIAITMNIYSHVMPSLQREAATIMDDLFKNPE